MKKKDKKIETCSVSCIHDDIIRRVGESMPPDDTFYDLAEFFKVFGDTTRIKILYALSSAEMCVCDMAALLGMSHSAISHQLRILKQTRLVKYRKEGKVVYYSLDDDHIKSIFDCGIAHVNE